MITKFNFNTLFAEAWLKSLIPANIVAGFRKCGVYPYNPEAITVTNDGCKFSDDIMSEGAVSSNEEDNRSPCDESGEHDCGPRE